MRPEKFAKLVDIQERLSALDEKVRFAIRQFDVGFLDPPEPEAPLTMVNSMNVGMMTGGAVQQGTIKSTQNISIDVQAAKTETFGICW